MTTPMEIDVDALARMRKDEAVHALIDVREDWELEICAVDGAVHIPMGTVPDRLGELPKDRPIVVLCHHGGRSAHVTMFLRRQGFDQAINLEGGIDAWARRIDPSMKVY